MTLDRFLGKVINTDARTLLAALPTASIDAVIADAMYGTFKNCKYEWGLDPAKGDPLKHWQYHAPLHRECLRVLKPGGVLAWGQGAKFGKHFRQWFGGHRIWTITRYTEQNATAHVWVVQTKEQQPIEFPRRDLLVFHEKLGALKNLHPCVKPVEELEFIVEELTKPNAIILDCFCGLGSTLIAVQRVGEGRRIIGGDRSKFYCQVAMKRLAEPDWVPGSGSKEAAIRESPKPKSEKSETRRTTKIEWTEATWNPVRGCTKISPGCKHCYAETFAERFRGVEGHPYERGFDLRLVPEKLDEPKRWKKGRRVFVNSMSDLFHQDVPDDYIRKVVDVMLCASQHTYQVLTKRSERMRDLLNGSLNYAAHARHIWWGVSVEDRKYGVPRIEHLRQANVAMRFLSVEPLLEDVSPLDLSGIHWVIVGGESGPGARPMLESWVLPIRDACRRQGVPFFFKQWGGVNKKKTGRVLQGKVYDEMPS